MYFGGIPAIGGPVNAGRHGLLIGFDLAGEGLERFQTVVTRSRIPITDRLGKNAICTHWFLWGLNWLVHYMGVTVDRHLNLHPCDLRSV